MANYTSTGRYREPASLSHHGYRDPPVYSSSYNRRPIHVIDSSSISSIDSVRSISPVRDRHRDRLSEDLLNNPLTRRVLPALLSRSNDADGRPLKVVMNYGNLYLDDSASADQVSSYSSGGYGGARRSGEQPNTVIYNAPGSTMAISSSSTGTSILRRPTSPLVRTVSPSDRFSSPERPRLRLPYRDTHFGQSGGSGYHRDTYHGARSRSHSQDRYGAGREQRRITYYETDPPSPTYSSLSTITSSTMSASPPGRHRMSGANGPGVVDMIDRRPMAMCLGCFKTMRVCSSGYCAACDFFPSSGTRGSNGNTYEREIVIERERDRTPTRVSSSKTVAYGYGGGAGGGGGHRGSTYVNDDLGTRRIRGVDMKGLGSQLKGLGMNGRKSRSRDRGRSREREIEFDVEIETGRDRNRDAVRELEKDRFRAKERAWERIEKEKRPGGPGGAGYGAGGIRARNGNGHEWDYGSDSEF
ncbi:hypothetical protein QBC37DRAFT_422863 [Rhypophila decipiens]|uniref:Uncharacterized protein n=1 Tax=Rhypophila decipiens TaxID=261697 RepID=A0AAN6Y7G7_9PEZI|nr:hypothetical protein QBC37DRAFT_422863 [Rhypophila decipiens]